MVICFLCEMMLFVVKKVCLEVEFEIFEDEFLDIICKQYLVVFDFIEMQVFQQVFDYGSEEWEIFYDYVCNIVEFGNE